MARICKLLARKGLSLEQSNKKTSPNVATKRGWSLAEF